MNVAVFGGFGKAPLARAGSQTRAGVLGGGDLDLTASRPADDARLTAIAVFGGIDVRVPAGTSVALSGLSLLGGRDVKVPPGDGPVLRVRAFAVLGGVTVKAGGA